MINKIQGKLVHCRKGERSLKDNINWVITLIASILTTGTLIYKAFFKKAIDREKNYYEKILKPFIEKCKVEDEKIALREIKNQIHHTDEFIPKYILYLMDEAKKNTVNDNAIEDMKLIKVLKCDYFDLYPNDEYLLIRLLKVFSKMLHCIIIFVAFLFLLVGGESFYNGFADLFSSNWSWLSMYEFAIGVIGFVMYIVCIHVVLLFDRDRYTIKKSKIERMVNKKVRAYDKRCNMFVS